MWCFCGLVILFVTDMCCVATGLAICVGLLDTRQHQHWQFQSKTPIPSCTHTHTDSCTLCFTPFPIRRVFCHYHVITGTYGRVTGRAGRVVLCPLCSRIGKPRQDDTHGSGIDSCKCRPDREPPASGQTKHVQPMPDLQTSVFTPLPDLQPLHITHGPSLSMDEQLHREWKHETLYPVFAVHMGLFCLRTTLVGLELLLL